MPKLGFRAMHPVERFWQYVDRSGECWTWTASLDRWGYGRFWLNGKHVQTHRYSYGLHFGIPPEGKLVIHSCDNPACVRPEHLTAGTGSDNMQDCLWKGRKKNAKLKPEEVIEIRKRGKAGEEYKTLAEEFGVSRSTVYLIVVEKTWNKTAHSRRATEHG